MRKLDGGQSGDGDRASGPRSDAGFSLVETLIALLLMGLIVVGVLSLLFTLTVVSAQASRQSQAEQYSIEVAEAIKAQGYDGNCSYGPGAVAPPDGIDPLPDPLPLSSIEEADLSTSPVGWLTCSPGGSTTLHRVTVETTDGDGAQARTVVHVRGPHA